MQALAAHNKKIPVIPHSTKRTSAYHGQQQRHRDSRHGKHIVARNPCMVECDLCRCIVGHYFCRCIVWRNLCRCIVWRNLCRCIVGRNLCRCIVGQYMYLGRCIVGRNLCQCIFSSPEHEVLMVSYCGQWLSVVRRRASCDVLRVSCVNIWCLHSRDHICDLILM